MAKKQRFDYFDAFQQQTKVALAEADLLIETIESFTTADDLQEAMKRAHEIEHQGDMLNHQVFQSVATEFLPPIDREDIIALTQYLDNIIDYMEDVIQAFYMYDVHTMRSEALEFAQVIKKSCGALDCAMEDFRNFKKSKDFKQLIVDVNTYEEEGDRLYTKAIRNLHVNEKDKPMRVMIWSKIFDRMEKCCDACEHVADTMATVLLKNA